MASQSTILGAAGEHYVMCELLRRGYIAALAPSGVPNADIVVMDIDAVRLWAIQVKARREIGSDGGWHMKKKHEMIEASHLLYCFVDFGTSLSEQPSTFIIPSSVVARVLRESHQRWLSNPGKKGQPHKDTIMRRLRPDYENIFGDTPNDLRKGWLERYRDAWDLLGPPQQSVEIESD